MCWGKKIRFENGRTLSSHSKCMNCGSKYPIHVETESIEEFTGFSRYIPVTITSR